MVPFEKRKIEVDLILNGERFAGGGNGKKYLDHAITVKTQKSGYPSMNYLTLRIMNMLQEDMDRVRVLGARILEVRNNLVVVKAGTINDRELVFQGNIFHAVPVFDGPDSFGMSIRAAENILAKVTPEAPRSVKGSVSGIQLLREYAEKMGLSFVDNGITDIQLVDPVFTGSLLDKAVQIAEALGVEMLTENGDMTVSPMEKGIGPVIEMNAEVGMISAPSYTDNGVRFRCMFNGKLRQGGLIDITSKIMPYAESRMKIIKIGHYLQSNGAGQAWETLVEAIRVPK